jgi:hypothetical protein
MKKLLFVALLFLPSLLFAQKAENYLASNGKTYNIGDTIKLGRGSGQNESFLYLQLGGWAAVATYSTGQGADQHNIGRQYAGMNVVVKKIKSLKSKAGTKIYLVVSGGNISNYNLLIEDAIATCEVADCNKQTATANSGSDNLDKLKKLKGLLDSGAITQAEYDGQKKKLLDL